MNLLSFKLNLDLGCSLATEGTNCLRLRDETQLNKKSFFISDGVPVMGFITVVSQHRQCHRTAACWKASEYLRGCK